jgi:hypothetical protein
LALIFAALIEGVLVLAAATFAFPYFDPGGAQHDTEFVTFCRMTVALMHLPAFMLGRGFLEGSRLLMPFVVTANLFFLTTLFWFAIVVKRNTRMWAWRRTYRVGTEISRLVAPDIRRDVQVLDTSTIAEGVITARVRTWNVFDVVKGIAEEPSFGAEQKLQVQKLWEWQGAHGSRPGAPQKRPEHEDES